jgi:hypothetical protein
MRRMKDMARLFVSAEAAEAGTVGYVHDDGWSLDAKKREIRRSRE